MSREFESRYVSLLAEGWREYWQRNGPENMSPLGVLGTGGRATVVAAVSSVYGPVAVKLPITSHITDTVACLSRIMATEGAILSEVEHPSLVALFEADPRGAYIVLELLSPESLAHRPARSSLEPHTALRWAAALADALGQLHRSGFLHLDVKPRNILLRPPAGRPVLIDLGSARPLRKLVQAGTIDPDKLGSRKYVFKAPEQLLWRTSNFTPATDAFGLGAALHWLLTGRPAFSNSVVRVDSLQSVYEGERASAVADCRRLGLPNAIVRVVARMLAFDPVERPADLTRTAQLFHEMAASMDGGETES